MIARMISLLLVVWLAALLAACGDEASADEPPDIEYGRDTCSRCNMIISEEQFAAGLKSEDGDEELIFDDAGEMVAYIQEESLDTGEWRVWVHDYESREWIDGKEAFYVESHDLVTPMGTGIAVFEARDAADTFAAANMGTVMDWQTVLAEWKMQMRSH